MEIFLFVKLLVEVYTGSMRKVQLCISLVFKGKIPTSKITRAIAVSPPKNLVNMNLLFPEDYKLKKMCLNDC